MKKSQYEYAFIVRTPYHYINALEATNKYNIKKKNSVLILWSNIFEERFDHLIEKGDWGDVFYLPVIYYDDESKIVNKIKNRALDFLYLVKVYYLSLRVEKVETSFAVLPNSKWVRHVINSLDSEKVIILDEGVAQFDIIKKYASESEKDSGSKRYGFDRSKNAQYEIFTSYPLSNVIKGVKEEKVTEHCFEFLRSKYNTSDFERECGLIIGSPHKGEKNSYYGEFLKKSISRIEPKVKNVFYKPHRNERKKYISSMSKIEDIEVIDNNLPIEIALLRKKVVPKYISSFYSTAIHSIYSIYGSKVKRVLIFKIKRSGEKEDAMYKYYENMDKKVVKTVSL